MFTGSSTNSSKSDELIRQAEHARQQRQAEKQRSKSALIIQSIYRGYRIRQINHACLHTQLNDLLTTKTRPLKANDFHQMTRLYLFLDSFSNVKGLSERDLARVCAHLVLSIQQGELGVSYVSLILSKKLYESFLWQSKRLVRVCVKEMSCLKLKEEAMRLEILMGFILVMVSTDRWKCFMSGDSVNKLVETLLNGTVKAYLNVMQTEGIFAVFNKCFASHLTNHKLLFSSSIQTHMVHLSLKLFSASNYTQTTLINLAANLLTLPGLVPLFLQLTPTCLSESSLNCRLYPLLTNSSAFLADKDLIQTVALLGNLCTIEQLDLNSFKINLDNFLIASTQIMDHCSRLHLNPTKSDQEPTVLTWTPLFGYLKLRPSITSPTSSKCFEEMLSQLRFLWSHRLILLLFLDSAIDNDDDTTLPSNNDKKHTANLKAYLQAFFARSTGLNKASLNQVLVSRSSMDVYRICSFYRKILLLFTEPRIEILSALSFEEEFLRGLWKYFSSLGPVCGCKELVKIVEKDRSFVHPIFDVLFVLSSLVLYLLTIFDEEEIFTKQAAFTRADFRLLASFLNQFLYEIVSCLAISPSESSNLEKNSYFSMFHQLLLVIYDKDCKQSDAAQMDKMWVVKEIKLKNFITDLAKNKSSCSMILAKIPHIIPLNQRIEILQTEILQDKERLEFANVRIKVRRSRLIEDGIDQINSLPSLKSTIRVKMVNEFGLSEAGIDQDGVFKEFLLDVIKMLLKPEMNLFKATSEQQLYPSSSSYFIEDHLKMFEFIGKLIGKAVYEGHVIDVQFAPFFLRQICGRGQRSANYSFLDDLATLDKELYKNLRSIKGSGMEIDELELTFTHSEMHLGRLVESELVPNGSEIRVTNENKIRYIHLLAHFKLHKQIRDQICAFDKGFKSVIKPEWLNLFTLAEVQTLISGSVVDLNLDDLRDNTQYWGGLHSQHRLVKWLFEILESDFDRKERGLFLKFVTSSSKPPLLGFASLNPQFTIRCVENNEEDGTIYDASFKSFFKTMLNIGNDKETLRLPTSSTCFNLLKLPNYSKKSTLKERLRYAITSNSGFELS